MVSPSHSSGNPSSGPDANAFQAALLKTQQLQTQLDAVRLQAQQSQDAATAAAAKANQAEQARKAAEDAKTVAEEACLQANQEKVIAEAAQKQAEEALATQQQTGINLPQAPPGQQQVIYMLPQNQQHGCSVQPSNVEMMGEALAKYLPDEKVPLSKALERGLVLMGPRCATSLRPSHSEVKSMSKLLKSHDISGIQDKFKSCKTPLELCRLMCACSIPELDEQNNVTLGGYVSLEAVNMLYLDCATSTCSDAKKLEALNDLIADSIPHTSNTSDPEAFRQAFKDHSTTAWASQLRSALKRSVELENTLKQCQENRSGPYGGRSKNKGKGKGKDNANGGSGNQNKPLCFDFVQNKCNKPNCPLLHPKSSKDLSFNSWRSFYQSRFQKILGHIRYGTWNGWQNDQQQEGAATAAGGGNGGSAGAAGSAVQG